MQAYDFDDLYKRAIYFLGAEESNEGMHLKTFTVEIGNRKCVRANICQTIGDRWVCTSGLGKTQAEAIVEAYLGWLKFQGQ